MCSHLALTKKNGRVLARELEADVPPDFDATYRPSERVGPAQPHWLLRLHVGPPDEPSSAGTMEAARRQLSHGALGLAMSGKKALLLNARAETVHRLPAFRDAFVRRRCLIPADAFFEWTGEKAARRAVRFSRPDGGLLLLGALYEEAVDPDTGEHRIAYAILTTRPNAVVAAVHDRMPVILPAGAVDKWLGAAGGAMNARELLSLLVPAPDDALVADGPAGDGPMVADRPPKNQPEKKPRLREQLNLFD